MHEILMFIRVIRYLYTYNIIQIHSAIVCGQIYLGQIPRFNFSCSRRKNTLRYKYKDSINIKLN